MGTGMDEATAALVQNELRGLHDIIEQLRTENEKLREYAVHKIECPTRRMFYIRECPHCGSRKNHWQGGGPGFEPYRVCEECDGPSYEPKERRGECTCGLEQALNETVDIREN